VGGGWLGGAFDWDEFEGEWEKVGFGGVVENGVLEKMTLRWSCHWCVQVYA
jgi:hypothetical protein